MKNDENQIKNEGAIVLTTLNIIFFKHSRAANSTISSGIWPKFKLIRDMVVLFIVKNMKIRSKIMVLDGYNTKCLFFGHSRAAFSAIIHGIWLNFKLVRDLIVVLVTVKNDEDQINNESG